ncbi:MAG: hypothetical protein Q7U06_01865 [Pseudomonadota bacterium]|nr:hypothetical protein [Pseudomonadota bacterium]
MTLLLLAAACTGGETLARGTNLAPFFPTDGDRRAEFINAASDEVPWTLIVEKLEPTETIDGVEHVTFEWSRDDTGELLGAVKWSSSSADGIAIHAWSGPDGAFVVFNPPVQVADDEMKSGDTVPTQTGGASFTSTFVGFEDCPVAWGDDWTGCAHLSIDDGDGDPMAGPPFAGDYWLVQRYGIAWMHTTGYAEKWDLAHHSWGEE